MRMLSIMAVSVFTLVLAASVVSRPTANVLVGEAIAVDQLTAKTKNLPVQSFDAF